MITIQSILLIVLGILCASLVVLLVAPAYWKRAVRLTTKQLKETLPISEAEMRAQMDRIRAEYAMRVHRLETQKKESKLAATRRLIEINRRDASISSLDSDLEQMKASLEENQNARRVLEQTVADRLPKVEQRLAEAKHLLFNRDKEITAAREATNVVKRAFEEATQINEQQSAQINRLNMSLATRAAKRSPDPREAGFEVELALRSEVEAMRAKTRDQSALISRMQRQIGQSFGGKGDAARELGRDLDRDLDQGGQANAGVLSAAAHSGAVEAADAEMSELKDSLVDAQNALKNAARGVTGDDMATREFEATIRKLSATNQDQSGEIARLRAALATFEGTNETGNRTIRDSKLALKARLNAVQVQAEQQSAVIAQLRAQLAAAHERTALQGQHFKIEMRRLGAGTMPAAGMARRAADITRPSSLAERIAQPRDDDNDDVSGKSSASAGTGAGDKDADDARAANGADRSGRSDRTSPAGGAGRSDRTGRTSMVAALDSQNGASDDSPAEVKLADEKDANDALTNGEDRAGKSLNVAASDLSDKVKEAAASIAEADADAGSDADADVGSGQSDNGTFAATPIVAPVDEGAALAGTAAAPLNESVPETTSAEADQTGADDDGLSVMERMTRNKKSKWKSSSSTSPAPAPTTVTTSTANAAAPLMARLEGKEAAAPGEQNDEPKSSSENSGPKVLVKPKIADRARNAGDEAKQNADGADRQARESVPEAKASVGVPARRRAKPRLLERLTGMAKGS